MNLKKAKKIADAYKLACSDGVPPVGDFDWQPSPIGFKQADLNLACRVLGTSISKLQEEAKPKAEPKKAVAKKPIAKKPVAKKVEAKSEPKKAVAKKSATKKSVAKKAEPKVEPKKEVKAEKVIDSKKEVKKSLDISSMFHDKDGNGIPDYKDKKPSSSKKKTSKSTDEKK